jgi:hypothetical protein
MRSLATHYFFLLEMASGVYFAPNQNACSAG